MAPLLKFQRHKQITVLPAEEGLSWWKKVFRSLGIGPYYVVGDGKHDEQAWMEAIDALPNNPGGKALGGPGRFTFSASCNNIKDGAHLQGCGYGTEIFLANNSNCHIFENQLSAVPIPGQYNVGILISDMRINGNHANQLGSPGGRDAVRIGFAKECVVRNLWIIEAPNYAIRFHDALDCVARDNFTYTRGTNDLYPLSISMGINDCKEAAGHGNNKVFNNKFDHGIWGQVIDNYGSDNTLIAYNTIRSASPGSCMSNEHTCKQPMIIGNRILSGGKHGITVTTSPGVLGPNRGFTIEANQVWNCQQDGIRIYTTGGQEIADGVIVGNRVYNCGSNGIMISEGNGSLTGVTVTGNVCRGMGSGHGILVHNAQDIVVVANNCKQNAYGMGSSGRANYNTFVANDVRGNNIDGISEIVGANNDVGHNMGSTIHIVG